MSTTIKDIATMAGVSIATVSHVMNKTRYVSPELEKKVMEIIEHTEYKEKLEARQQKLRSGYHSSIAYVAPDVSSPVYSKLIETLSQSLGKHGYFVNIYISHNDLQREKQILEVLPGDKELAGVILTPVSDSCREYPMLSKLRVPLICLERTMQNAAYTTVLSDTEHAMQSATLHLLQSGHEKVMLLLEQWGRMERDERYTGYQKAFESKGMKPDEALVVRLDITKAEGSTKELQVAILKTQPTAVIAAGNRLTLSLLRALNLLGKECPKDISVIGYGDEEMSDLLAPPLTAIKQNTTAMAEAVTEELLKQIQGERSERRQIKIDSELLFRKSVQVIGKGPFGERAIAAEELVFTQEETQRLREGDYKAAIAFHYTGTNWSKLHESGIRMTLEQFGIKVVSVMDAHFDPELQVMQLEGIALQKPDVVIAVPVDDRLTAPKFLELSKKSKLIFISNVPDNFQKDDYASCVSVNERENGQNAAMLMGEYFREREKVKVGFINHGAPFYGTNLRDRAARQAVEENYRNLQIVAQDNFYTIENAYEVCKRMIAQHPDVLGLYVSWDRPALEVIRALREMHREDISIFTFDLDMEISSYLAKGEIVRGLSTQHPYEQGVAVGLAAAKALLGQAEHKYIAVRPSVITQENLVKAWKEIVHEPVPEQFREWLTK